MADKKQASKGSDNSGTRVKRDPVKGEAELSREVNKRPENMRLKVLLPSMKVRLMSVPEYRQWMAARYAAELEAHERALKGASDAS